MTNVCPACGAYRADKIVDPQTETIACPECGHRRCLRFLPLLLVGGPSGAGKSAVLLELVTRSLPVVLLDADTIWSPRFDDPGSNYREFFETWLRIARNINQSGRPCVLFGAGAAVPHNIIPCVEARYFARFHYLALVAEDEVLRQRLHARSSWRGSSVDDNVTAQTQFAHWLKSSEESAQHGIVLVDTTDESVTASAGRVAAWISGVLGLEVP